MKIEAHNMLEELQQRLDGHYVFLVYQYMQFCIKAEPGALLSTTIEFEGRETNIENIAKVRFADEYTFVFTLDDPDFILPFLKGLGKEHPEFRLEQKEEETDANNKEKKKIEIYCTMPEMNEDRHDAGLDYIKVIYDATLVQLDLLLTKFLARIPSRLGQIMTPEEIDEFKDQLKEKHEETKKRCDSTYADKEKEIEDAYQEYLKKENEAHQAETEREQAMGTRAGMSMQMEYNEEEEDDPFE